ncbi:MAG TPA: hypothetical protein VHA14_08075, partial [Bryobacteraceae bacterium]|nr:hypothetical protein [Bryobacteraceae bacterium]
IYSWLLHLYPAELREDFGLEMMQVFLDDMEDGRQRHGFCGAARVWWRSLKEFCQIALPAAARTPKLIFPVFIYLSQALYFYSLLRPHRGLAVLFVPAITTFIALEARDYDVPDPALLTRPR